MQSASMSLENDATSLLLEQTITLGNDSINSRTEIGLTERPSASYSFLTEVPLGTRDAMMTMAICNCKVTVSRDPPPPDLVFQLSQIKSSACENTSDFLTQYYDDILSITFDLAVIPDYPAEKINESKDPNV
eukprot:GHVR01007104.1.p1 GENE.GHVR01007104.1~~GHVR01007104.1.p1  ORF type:complete len:132 (+),score=0.44 GHVR01007104.1:109-504(+)